MRHDLIYQTRIPLWEIPMTNLNYSIIWIAIFLLTISLFESAEVYGQQTTEQFVPIGQSPGISNKYSYIGDIVSVNTEAHTITVQSNRGSKTIRVLTTTRIWLDRSSVKRTK